MRGLNRLREKRYEPFLYYLAVPVMMKMYIYLLMYTQTNYHSVMYDQTASNILQKESAADTCPWSSLCSSATVANSLHEP